MHLPGTSRTVHFALLTIGALLLSSVMLFCQTTTADQAAPNAYGGCTAPAKAGVHVCYPVNITNSGAGVASPFQVIAAGTGAGGPVKLMEVWADGKKIAQASGNLFDAPVTLPIGNHRFNVVEVDSTGAVIRGTPFNVSVENTTAHDPCAPPSSPGVNVCIPFQNNCHTDPWITVVAAGTGASGTVSRMELWLNSTKLANFPGNHINTNIFYITDFNKITIIEVDSKGNYIKSAPISLQTC
jgi:hypothetical protein